MDLIKYTLADGALLTDPGAEHKEKGASGIHIRSLF